MRGTIDLTSLERTAELALKELGIKYIKQFSTRTGFVIDFAVLNGRIAIEIDGPFHDLPRARLKDRIKNWMLKREGWHIIRIHWSEIDSKSIQDLAELIKHKLYS